MELRMHLGFSLDYSQRLILPGSGFLNNQPAHWSLAEFLTPNPSQKLCSWNPALEVLGHAQDFFAQLVPRLLQQPLNLSLEGSLSTHPTPYY